MAFQDDLQALIQAKGLDYVAAFKTFNLDAMANALNLVGAPGSVPANRQLFATALSRLVTILQAGTIPTTQNWLVDDLFLSKAETKAMGDFTGMVVQFWSSVNTNVVGDWHDWIST